MKTRSSRFLKQVPSAHASSRMPPVGLSLLAKDERLRTCAGVAPLEPQGKVQIRKSKLQELPVCQQLLELLTHVHKPGESPSGSLVQVQDQDQDQDQGHLAVRPDLLLLDILNRRNEFLQFVQVLSRSCPGPVQVPSRSS